MREDLFIDTTLLHLTAGEKKRNTISLPLSAEFKVQTMALTFLKCANYILHYNALIMKTGESEFDDKKFFYNYEAVLQQPPSTGKAFAYIPPTVNMKQTRFEYFSSQSILDEMVPLLATDSVRGANTFPQMLVDELLLNRLEIETPAYTAKPIQLIVTGDGDSLSVETRVSYETFVENLYFQSGANYEFEVNGDLAITDFQPAEGEISDEDKESFKHLLKSEGKGSEKVTAFTLKIDVGEIRRWFETKFIFYRILEGENAFDAWKVDYDDMIASSFNASELVKRNKYRIFLNNCPAPVIKQQIASITRQGNVSLTHPETGETEAWNLLTITFTAPHNFSNRTVDFGLGASDYPHLNPMIQIENGGGFPERNKVQRIFLTGLSGAGATYNSTNASNGESYIIKNIFSATVLKVMFKIWTPGVFYPDVSGAEAGYATRSPEQLYKEDADANQGYMIYWDCNPDDHDFTNTDVQRNYNYINSLKEHMNGSRKYSAEHASSYNGVNWIPNYHLTDETPTENFKPGVMQGREKYRNNTFAGILHWTSNIVGFRHWSETYNDVTQKNMAITDFFKDDLADDTYPHFPTGAGPWYTDNFSDDEENPFRVRHVYKHFGTNVYAMAPPEINDVPPLNYRGNIPYMKFRWVGPKFTQNIFKNVPVDDYVHQNLLHSSLPTELKGFRKITHIPDISDTDDRAEKEKDALNYLFAYDRSKHQHTSTFGDPGTATYTTSTAIAGSGRLDIANDSYSFESFKKTMDHIQTSLSNIYSVKAKNMQTSTDTEIEIKIECEIVPTVDQTPEEAVGDILNELEKSSGFSFMTHARDPDTTFDLDLYKGYIYTLDYESKLLPNIFLADKVTFTADATTGRYGTDLDPVAASLDVDSNIGYAVDTSNLITQQLEKYSFTIPRNKYAQGDFDIFIESSTNSASKATIKYKFIHTSQKCEFKLASFKGVMTLAMEKETHDFQILPRWLYPRNLDLNSTFRKQGIAFTDINILDDLIRLAKGDQISFEMKFINEFYEDGFKKMTPGTGFVPMENMSNSIEVSLLFDTVEFISLKLQDLYYNRPLPNNTSGRLLNNLQIIFETRNNQDYPILNYDPIVLKLELEG